MEQKSIGGDWGIAKIYRGLGDAGEAGVIRTVYIASGKKTKVLRMFRRK